MPKPTQNKPETPRTTRCDTFKPAQQPAPYRPGSGLRDVGGGITAGYWFSERFGVTARAGATYLVGAIADSPIGEEGAAGSRPPGSYSPIASERQSCRIGQLF